jgi:5-methylcytosine-specific restriction protein A
MPERPGGKFLKIRRERRREAIRENHKKYNRTREDKDMVSLYGSARWKTVRRLKLQRDPLCEICRAKGDLVPAQMVHHIKEAKERPDLFFDIENLQSLCNECHNRLHKKST